MRSPTDRGRIYHRYGCREAQRRHRHQVSRLAADLHHGTRAFALDVPFIDDHRHTVRRAGSPDKVEARIALHRFNLGLDTGAIADPRQTCNQYLTEWGAQKEQVLKPTTTAATTPTSTRTSSP